MATVQEQHEYYQQEFVRGLVKYVHELTQDEGAEYHVTFLMLGRLILERMQELLTGVEEEFEPSLLIANRFDRVYLDVIEPVWGAIKRFTDCQEERLYLLGYLLKETREAMLSGVDGAYVRVLMHEPHRILGGEPVADVGAAVHVREREVEFVSFDETRYAEILRGLPR